MTSSDSEDGVTFTAIDREMLQTISEQHKKLEILKQLKSHVSELKSNVSDLKQSVEYNIKLMEELKMEQQVLKKSVVKLEDITTTLMNENAKLKKMLLDLQSRNMRDNLLIMGIEKECETYEILEGLIRAFMRERLE